MKLLTTLSLLTLSPLALSHPSLTSRAPTFPALHSLPGRARIVNNCAYPVFVTQVFNGREDPLTRLAPHTYTDLSKTAVPFKCNIATDPACGGVALKAAYSAADYRDGHVAQVEYIPKNSALIYDITLARCITRPGGCVGLERGLAAVASGPKCANVQCVPGGVCVKSPYAVGANDPTKISPGGLCSVDNGLIFSLCALDGGGALTSTPYVDE